MDTEKKIIYGVVSFFVLICIFVSGYGYAARYGTPDEKDIRIVPNFCEPGLKVSSLELSGSGGPLSISYTIGPGKYSTERRSDCILVNSSMVPKGEWIKSARSEGYYLFAHNYINKGGIIRVEGVVSTSSVLYQVVKVDSFNAIGFVPHMYTVNNDYIQIQYSPNIFLYFVVFIMATLILLFWVGRNS
jgi:hypothetical protein